MAKREFQIGGPRSTYVLIVCSTLYMVNYMDRQVLSVVLEPMKIDLGLTDTQAGLIQTGFLMSMGVFSIPISYMVDRWSRNKAISIMAVFWSATTFLTGLGRNFIGVFVPRSFTGAGEAAFSSGAIALISASYPEADRSKKLAVYNMFLLFGIAAGMVLGGYLSANHGGWRTPFFVFAIPGVILAILAWFMQDYDNKPADDAAGPEFAASVAKLMRIRTLVWVYAGWGMHNLMSFSIMVWSAALIMRKFGVGEDTAGIVVAITGALAVPGVLLGGTLADRYQAAHPAGRMRFAALADIATGAGIVLCIVTAFLIHPDGSTEVSVWMVLGLVFFSVYAIGAIAGQPAVGAVTQDVVPSELKGLSYGLAMFLMYVLGGGWSPWLTGLLSDHFGGEVKGLAYAMIITGASGFLAFACWWMASRHYAEDAARAKEALTD
jgi:MFS family permease